MSEQNPFAAPTVDPTASPGEAGGPLAALDDKTVKRLRNASHSIRALGVLWSLGFVLYIAVGIMTTVGVTRAESRDPGLGSIFFFGLAALTGAAAWGMFTRPEWGRILGICLCALSLLGFPIGTLIGALCLYYLIPSGRLFGPGRIPHAAINDEFKRRKALGWR